MIATNYDFEFVCRKAESKNALLWNCQLDFFSDGCGEITLDQYAKCKMRNPLYQTGNPRRQRTGRTMVIDAEIQVLSSIN